MYTCAKDMHNSVLLPNIWNLLVSSFYLCHLFYVDAMCITFEIINSNNKSQLFLRDTVQRCNMPQDTTNSVIVPVPLWNACFCSWTLQPIFQSIPWLGREKFSKMTPEGTESDWHVDLVEPDHVRFTRARLAFLAEHPRHFRSTAVATALVHSPMLACGTSSSSSTWHVDGGMKMASPAKVKRFHPSVDSPS